MMAAATLKVAGPGQQAYTTAGSYTFTVPAGVTSICAVCVGSGSGGGGGYGGGSGYGGDLRYVNSISVTAGESLTVVVGAGGVGGTSIASPGDNNLSSVSRGATALVRAYFNNTSGIGTGGQGGTPQPGSSDSSGGCGAAGYSGTPSGGQGGATGGPYAATAGTNGGGGGGGYSFAIPDDPNVGDVVHAGGGGGGGVGILGTGSNGSAGVSQNTPTGGGGGASGNSGADGAGPSSGVSATINKGGNGGAYGGGGASGGYYYDSNASTLYFSNGGNGAVGAVRIMWGTGRSYPSNAANV